MRALPTFVEWYEELHNPPGSDGQRSPTRRTPFPWQARLARQVEATEQWPDEIAVPTGTGKTTCIDIALWLLAIQADRPPEERTAPTRLWWVVNRRLLVDATTDHALYIAELLETAKPGTALFAVASALRGIAGHSPDSVGARPLQVVTLRGGASFERPLHPAQPSFIAATVPMYGSRLLFRGYGSSRSMRPVDAALAGTDSLVMVDEAHLAPHLRTAVGNGPSCFPPEITLLPTARQTARVVELTATGRAGDYQRFDLDEADHAHPLVARRLHASKPTTLVLLKTNTKKVSKELARQTVALIAEQLTAQPRAPRAVVFVNSPRRAREVADSLQNDHRLSAHIEVATGQMREFEASAVRRQIVERVSAGLRSENSEDRPLVVVATQTLEVGADLDFDCGVIEACGRRSLIQRLGRINRLGENPAKVRYVHTPPDLNGPPARWYIYGSEPADVITALRTAESTGSLDLSPSALGDIMSDVSDDPALIGRAPEMLRELLWEWVKTTTPPEGEAPVEPYFSGLEAPDRRVTVLWRAHIPHASDSGTLLKLWPRVRHDETLDIRLEDLRASLADSGNDQPLVARLSPDRVTVERVHSRDLRPGDTVILPSSVGLYDQWGWAPASSTPVSDLSVLRDGLPLDSEALRVITDLISAGLPARDAAWMGARDAVLSASAMVTAALESDDPADAGDVGQLCGRLVAALDALASMNPAAHEWQRLFRRIADISVTAGAPGEDPDRGIRLRQPISAPANEVARIEAGQDNSQPRSDEWDELSQVDMDNSVARELDAHGAAVGLRSGQLARAVGLDKRAVASIALAGELHDVGKVDSRFQRWLSATPAADPARDGQPIKDAESSGPSQLNEWVSSEQKASTTLLAKSDLPRRLWGKARVASGWPAGGRHEDLSARLVSAWLEKAPRAELADVDTDLLVHLVLSHHGSARPLLPAPYEPDGPSRVSYKIRGTAVDASADLTETDWGQPARFRRLNERYGPWGLALAEALVRQADHQVSAGFSPEHLHQPASDQPATEVL